MDHLTCETETRQTFAISGPITKMSEQFELAWPRSTGHELDWPEVSTVVFCLDRKMRSDHETVLPCHLTVGGATTHWRRPS